MKFKKFLCVFCTIAIVLSLTTTSAFASENINTNNDKSTEISATIQGADASLTK